MQSAYTNQSALGNDVNDVQVKNAVPPVLYDEYKKDKQQYNDKLDRILGLQNEAKYMVALSQQASGRGVPKTAESPAQLQGLNPQNPQYFGITKKNPVPYDRLLTNANNLSAVMRGYQEVEREVPGSMPLDSANIIAQMQNREGLVRHLQQKQQRDSIYAGVPKSAAANLFEIELKNLRENSLYAFN